MVRGCRIRQSKGSFTCPKSTWGATDGWLALMLGPLLWETTNDRKIKRQVRKTISDGVKQQRNLLIPEKDLFALRSKQLRS